jgi:hypothetical protein
MSYGMKSKKAKKPKEKTVVMIAIGKIKPKTKGKKKV